jgi:polyhydroxyalkanoate synthesis regulator phasin
MDQSVSWVAVMAWEYRLSVGSPVATTATAGAFVRRRGRGTVVRHDMQRAGVTRTLGDVLNDAHMCHEALKFDSVPGVGGKLVEDFTKQVGRLSTDSAGVFVNDAYQARMARQVEADNRMDQAVSEVVNGRTTKRRGNSAVLFQNRPTSGK